MQGFALAEVPGLFSLMKGNKINKRNSGKITKSNPFLTLLLVLILFSLYNISDRDAVIVSSILSAT